MTNKPKRKRKHRLPNKQIVIGLAIFLGLIFASSFLLVVYLATEFADTTTMYYGDEAITKIAEYIENPLSDSATDVSIAIDSWIDTQIQIVFRMPPEDAEGWLMNSSLCFDHRLPSLEENPNANFDDPTWWHLDRAIDGKLSTNCFMRGYHHTIEVDISEVTHWTFAIMLQDF